MEKETINNHYLKSTGRQGFHRYIKYIIQINIDASFDNKKKYTYNLQTAKLSQKYYKIICQFEIVN